MPELPEVETIRRDLEKKIINKKIINVQVNLPKLIKIPQANQFVTCLKGSFVKDVKRRGKYILFILSTADYFIIHLGMSGRLLYQSSRLTLPKINEKYNHILFYFEDGSKMIYNDVRQFGKVWLFKKDEKLPAIESLGFEPLECHFTFDEFYRLLQISNGNIKSLIMNQKKIAGIGNIYANEILFHAGIYPLRKANSLTKIEVRRIFLNIRDVLSKAIELRGTTMIDESYCDLYGEKGGYERAIMVYGKKKGKCPLCGLSLKVIRIENRSTFVCSKCQR